MIDLFTNVFFESPVLLAIFVAVAIAIAMAVHRRRQTSASKRGLWITLVACALLFLLQSAIETDREKIQAVTTAMANAIDEGDIAGLGAHLDAQFEDRSLNKEQWLADVRQRLQQWSIDNASIGGFNITLDGDTATVSFRASCDWRRGERVENSVFSVWKLQFTRHDDGWKLTRVLDAKFGPGGMLDYSAILQY